jgi:hypothetical protein
MLRYLVSSVFPLFTIQMIVALKFQWAISLLGFIGIAVLPVPWLIYKFGPRLRAKSYYMSSRDKQVAA